jgi:hypothetical protein
MTNRAPGALAPVMRNLGVKKERSSVHTKKITSKNKSSSGQQKSEHSKKNGKGFNKETL